MIAAQILLLGTSFAALPRLPQSEPQRYAQYIDAESAVVKRPEGEGWDDPFGDGVWRSSWFYACLLAIHAKDRPIFDRLEREHGVKLDQVDRFLRYFADH